MIANLDKNDESSALGSLRRRIVGTDNTPKKESKLVFTAPPKVDGNEPVNEYDMEAIWYVFGSTIGVERCGRKLTGRFC